MNASAPTARRGSLDLGAGGVGPAEGDVVGDRAGEEEALLRHDPELAAQRRLRDVAQVDAVDRDPPVARVVEAREELRDRRLPGARVADERDRRPWRDVEVEVVEDVREVAVPEADVLEADVALDRRELAARPAASTTSGSSSRTAVIRSSAAVAERNVL